MATKLSFNDVVCIGIVKRNFARLLVLSKLHVLAKLIKFIGTYLKPNKVLLKSQSSCFDNTVKALKC